MAQHKARKFARHLPHYMPLVGIFTAGILAFIIFSYDRHFQAGVAVSVALAHIIWGIVHHYIHGDLSFEIILEYIAIACLGLAAVLSIVLRG